MTQIGTQEMAALALAMHKGGNDPEVSGFKFLGAGCFRSAYLGTDGVVYKVATRGSTGQSLREVERAEKYRQALEGMRDQYPDWEIALCHLYMVEDQPVVAMEFHEGAHERQPEPCPRYWAEFAHYAEAKAGNCEGCKDYMAYAVDTTKVYEFAGAIDYYDMHPGNYVIRHSDGKRVLIDCG